MAALMMLNMAENISVARQWKTYADGKIWRVVPGPGSAADDAVLDQATRETNASE